MRTSGVEPCTDRIEYLSVQAMTAGYGAGPIIQDVSLGVVRGEVTCVIGPNGAGKSTLLKTLTGRLKPMSGRVLLDGVDVTAAPGDRLTRAGLGYVPQTNDVFNPLTVRENLELGAYLLPKSRQRQRISEVLDVLPTLVPLLKRTGKLLSGGERKLLAIARCLVLEPTVIVLDEPTANLSPGLARSILHEHVTALAQTGAAVLLVEQKALDAMRISHWCYVLVGGRVHLSSPPEPLLAAPDFGQVFLGMRTMSGAVARAVDRPNAGAEPGPEHLGGQE
ncbi:MAG: livF1 [Pseudonocardiales bacterium]|nr:livF1 [Pseudonocardiales bacterium]